METTHLLTGHEILITCLVQAEDKVRSPYLYVPVLMPTGTTLMNVKMTYDKSEACVIDLGILDSRATGFPTQAGFRGWSGGARNSFFIATDAATPGYVQGNIPDGKWQIVLGLYKVPPMGTTIHLNVMIDDSDRPLKEPVNFPTVTRSGTGWYKGDLHCHTHHSDARGTPEILHQTAQHIGLDFLSVTDHNTITQWQYFGHHSSPKLVFVQGMEITTYNGHINIFGLNNWIDFRLECDKDVDILVQAAHDQGALVSVNHDKPPLPWLHKLPSLDCMEVWQNHWLAGNEHSLKLYDQRISEGQQISLIGGSDYHQPEQFQPDSPFILGCPTTVLWLENLNQETVLEGLRCGNGYVTESPEGPHLSFTIGKVAMGNVVRVTGKVTAQIDVRGAAGDYLVWISEQGPVAKFIIPSDIWQSELPITCGNIFLRVEIQAAASHDKILNSVKEWYKDRPVPRGFELDSKQPQVIRRALSNPVYFQVS